MNGRRRKSLGSLADACFRGLRNASEVAGSAMFHKIDAAQDKEKSSANRGERTGPEELREARPPGRGGRQDGFGIADDSLGFQLSADRNPNTIGGSDLGRNVFCGNNDGGNVCEQILTMGAAGEMLASIKGKRTESLYFENGFEFLTLHTTNSAGPSTGRLSLQKSTKVQMRVVQSSTLASF